MGSVEAGLSSVGAELAVGVGEGAVDTAAASSRHSSMPRSRPISATAACSRESNKRRSGHPDLQLRQADPPPSARPASPHPPRPHQTRQSLQERLSRTALSSQEGLGVAPLLSNLTGRLQHDPFSETSSGPASSGAPPKAHPTDPSTALAPQPKSLHHSFVGVQTSKHPHAGRDPFLTPWDWRAGSRPDLPGFQGCCRRPLKRERGTGTPKESAALSWPPPATAIGQCGRRDLPPQGGLLSVRPPRPPKTGPRLEPTAPKPSPTHCLLEPGFLQHLWGVERVFPHSPSLPLSAILHHLSRFGGGQSQLFTQGHNSLHLSYSVLPGIPTCN